MSSDLMHITSTLQMLDDDQSEHLLALTYAQFFKVCPQAQALWEKDNPDSRGKMFNGIVLTLMDNMTRPEVCEINLASDVKNHDEYGVNREMYGLFFSSLHYALADTLGDAFSEDMSLAWKNQLQQLEKTAHKHTQR